MLEKNKDYIIYTKYIDGKPEKLQICMGDDFCSIFKIKDSIGDFCFYDEPNALVRFFNDCYDSNKAHIDKTIKEMESEDEFALFEDENNEYRVMGLGEPGQFEIVARTDLASMSFEDFYTLKDNWENATVSTKEIVPVKDRIKAFKEHFTECFKRIGCIRSLDDNDYKDKGIFIPLLFEKDNELKEYLMLVDYVYYDSDDCVMNIYCYDHKANKIITDDFYYGYGNIRTNLFMPHRRTKFTDENIDNWYSFYESLIALYEYDKESFDFIYSKYLEFLKEKLAGDKFSRFLTEETISEFKPLHLCEPKSPYREYIDI